MEEKDFQPYSPAGRVLPELTGVSVALGIVLAVVFGGANAYLGLRVGMTVSASVPAAVISMGVVRKLLRRDSILENNMVQTIGSAGESVAAGAIFTLPALFMWAREGRGEEPGLFTVGLIALCGGVLGVLLMIPLRRALIVKEHASLPYPEGRACAQVLLAGEKGGRGSGAVFAGLGGAAGYKLLADGLGLFPSRLLWPIPGYRGAGFGLETLPALAGVGYICGGRVSSYLFAGGVLGWLVILPLMALFGGEMVLFPAGVSVNALLAAEGPSGLWSHFLRYVGAGAVACGGAISLVKSLPLIVRTFRAAVKEYGHGGGGAQPRTGRDLPLGAVLGGALAAVLVLWLAPAVPLGLPAVLLAAVLGFFFAAVSARMVGLIGSSNNPVSGMAIATLLLSSLVLKGAGVEGMAGMTAAIAIGGVICVVASIAGDTSQDLKTGFLVGATPWKQQVGELIGAAAAAAAMGAILYLLSAAWGYGSEELPAPQATLMKLVVEGVMEGNLPWNLVIAGVFLALTAEILGVPVLPFAIGLYLPIYLSAPIMLGGAARWAVEKSRAPSAEIREKRVQSGVLCASGLIAGEGLVGIALAVLAVIPAGGGTAADVLRLDGISLGAPGSLAAFALVLGGLYLLARRGGKSP